MKLNLEHNALRKGAIRLGSSLLCAWLASSSTALTEDDPFSVSSSLTRSETGEYRLAVRFSIPENHYLYAKSMSVTPSQGVTLAPVDIPAPERKFDPIEDSEVDMYTRDTIWRYALGPLPPSEFSIVATYQGCDPVMCLFPQTRTLSLALDRAESAPASPAPPQRSPDSTPAHGLPPSLSAFDIVGRADGYLGPAAFIEFLENVEAGKGMEKDAIARAFDENRAWLAIVLIVALGLALNLTPCVLPMIPVNLAIIGAGAQASSRLRGLALGGMYGAGMALAYGTLGLIVALGFAQFGTLNAHPLFNAVIAVVFLVLALAMFGVFNVDFTRFQSSLSAGKQGRGRVWTAFFFGGVTALLAGACVAPVLISVLTLSARFYAQGIRAALLLPFLLGAAMALPWPLAGAGLSFMPKPGRWMVWIKVGFGIVILAAALYYGHEAWRLHAARQDAETPATETTMPVQDAEPDLVDDGIAWFTELEPALQAAREQDKPVYVDVWATWCVSCLRMNRTTFQDPEVIRKLQDYIAVKFQAEDLKAPDIKPTLDAMGVTLGLPAHAVLEKR